MKNVLFSLITFLSLAMAGFAQTGTIKGQVKDSKTEEPIIGATIVIETTSLGGATDIDGNFSITNIPIGTYKVSVAYVGYKTKGIDSIQVQEGKIVVINTQLSEDSETLVGVEIIGQKETGTEIAVISEIKEAQQVAVGVSNEQITKNQDRDAAQVARRVPGVSIIDNRFVLVRGLGQRYNTVMINDVITPSTEVDSRSFSFDLVPSQIVDKMMIYKSGSAELPGDFAGGVIKIYTRKAPEEDFTNFSLSTGVRIGTTFTKAQSYQGSPTDFLGFDNGTRALPKLPSQIDFNGSSSTQQGELATKFKDNWAVNTKNINPDVRFNFGLGRRIELKNTQIGNFTNINYSNTSQFADVSFNSYLNSGNESEIGQKEVTFNDQQLIKNARFGIVNNWSAKFSPRFSLELKNLFNQMGTMENVVRDGVNIAQNKEILSYSQRYESKSIYSGQLVGKHDFNERFNLNWQIGYGYTNRKEPDWKRVVYSRVDNTQTFSTEADGQLTSGGRFFSNLNENTITVATNAEYKLNKNANTDKVAKLKFGFYTEQKDRTFTARFFGYSGGGALKTLPVGTIFNAGNIGGSGFNIAEKTLPTDKYKASNSLGAGYVALVTPFAEKFNLNVGIRAEYNVQKLSSLGLDTPVNTPVLNILPSLNLSYNLNDKQLVRVAYSYTLNRPELRELAPFAYYDFNVNAVFAGNENLKTSNIHNVDARYELYPSLEEMITFGVFYKDFQKPIETYLNANSSGTVDYTFVNAKNAQSYGVEAEIRKSFLSSSVPFFQNLSVVANASYIISKVNIGETVEVSRVKDPTGISQTAGSQDANRPMANQSPYVVNAGLYYNNTKKGFQVNLLYNVFGKRIFAVGNNLSPTIYEMPRNVIDLNITKTFKNKLEIRFNAQDLLNQAVRLEQDSNRDGKVTASDKQPYRTFKRGSYFTLGVAINF